jgi:hypothetical protein
MGHHHVDPQTAQRAKELQMSIKTVSATHVPDTGVLDEAYERLHHTGPEFGGHPRRPSIPRGRSAARQAGTAEASGRCRGRPSYRPSAADTTRSLSERRLFDIGGNESALPARARPMEALVGFGRGPRSRTGRAGVMNPGWTSRSVRAELRQWMAWRAGGRTRTSRTTAFTGSASRHMSACLG